MSRKATAPEITGWKHGPSGPWQTVDLRGALASAYVGRSTDEVAKRRHLDSPARQCWIRRTGATRSQSDGTRECYIAEVREIVRRHWRYFFFFTTVAVALRLFFIFRYPSISGDSLIYGDIAKNWLRHGVYGLSVGNGAQPTYIRLPGYPAFLAFTFKIAGMEHYPAAHIA